MGLEPSWCQYGNPASADGHMNDSVLPWSEEKCRNTQISVH